MKVHYGAELTHGARVDAGWTYRGLHAVVLENEELRAIILAGKGADVYSLVHKPTDTEFLWRSPIGVRDPRWYTPTDGNPVAMWVDHYEGGWQTIVPAGGYAGEYRGVTIGLHGEANMMPWDVVAVDDGPDRASVRFRVRLARTPFTVTKELAMESGSPTLVVRESVTNDARELVHAVWGQHIALGAPFLSDRCVIDIPGGTVHAHPVDAGPTSRLKPGASTSWPHAALKDGTEASIREVPGEDAKLFDQAYIGDMPDGWYAVTNSERGVGFACRWPLELYRYLWYWQVFGGGFGYPWWGRTYNIGLEPFTSYPNTGLEEAVLNDEAIAFEAGETKEAEVRVTAFRSVEGVEDVRPDGMVVTKETR